MEFGGMRWGGRRRARRALMRAGLVGRRACLELLRGFRGLVGFRGVYDGVVGGVARYKGKVSSASIGLVLDPNLYYEDYI